MAACAIVMLLRIVSKQKKQILAKEYRLKEVLTDCDTFSEWAEKNRSQLEKAQDTILNNSGMYLFADPQEDVGMMELKEICFQAYESGRRGRRG